MTTPSSSGSTQRRPRRMSLLHLTAPLGEVELLIDGTPRWVPVVPLDGVSVHAIATAERETGALPEPDDCYKIAGQVMPSLTEAQVRQISLAQVGVVIGIASEHVAEAQEHHDPNGAGPTATVPPQPPA